ncbi:helix-turn-helix domain-containing protein [Phenylobacterium sp.]|uniref:helix-turn-helix domain-containing protein n=1 Tax=Phenylobacterium sp. TaxID=1871053 RepID=UPI0035AFA584
MPLDTGGLSQLDFRVDGESPSGLPETFVPTVQSGPDIGSALKAAREFRGLTLSGLAETTRIRAAYLEAIEQMRLERLPSRPFTIGYIRAYAKALGLDGDAAVERFRAETPAPEDGLRAPVGVTPAGDPRLAAIAVGAALIIGAIVLWNIAQRAINEEAPPPSAAPETAAPVVTASGPVTLGAPLPAPVESTTPPPYETPGLAAAAAAGGSADAALAAAAQRAKEAAAPPVPAAPLPATFSPAGAVYGVDADKSLVTLQALKSTSLIVRGADGSVYFARQLAAGEAYRAPMLDGLVAEVSDPHAIHVFVAGQTKGLLPDAKTALSKLAD